MIDLERLIEAEESEGKKDEIAVESLIKMTGHNEADCTEYLAMSKLEGVSTMQAYHKALATATAEEERAAVAVGIWHQQQVNRRQLEEGRAAAAVGTGTDSGSGTGTGAGSGKPAYSAEPTAGTETDRERNEDEREIRRNNREVQRAKALEADEVKKAKGKKAAADKSGPSGDPRNVQAEKEELALAQMCTITGRSEEQCAQALAIQTEPGRDFLEVYHRACHMLMEDGDPAKEGWANLAKGFQG